MKEDDADWFSGWGHRFNAGAVAGMGVGLEEREGREGPRRSDRAAATVYMAEGAAG